MKKLHLFIAIILFSLTSIAQNFPVNQSLGSPTTLITTKGGGKFDSALVVPVYTDTAKTSNYTKNYDGSTIWVGNKLYVRQKSLNKWINITGSGGGGTLIQGGAITSIPILGFNPATTDIAEWIDNVFYASQVPTSSLTGGQSLELIGAGAALSYTLNWSGGRQSATNPLSTIVVDGVSQTFIQPLAGASVSGTKLVSVVRNSNTTFSNVVTTTDSKTATSTTSFTFSPKRYGGVTSGTAANNADLLAATGGYSELTSTKSKSTFDITVSGTNLRVFVAYPSSYGALSSIIISGLESIDAFTQTTLSVTNALGFVQNYLVYTSNNQFNNTTISFNSVN